MVDPVIAADGHTYERSEIFQWLKQKDVSPLTGAIVEHKELISNFKLKMDIQEWKQKKEKNVLKSNVNDTLDEDIIVDEDDLEEVKT